MSESDELMLQQIRERVSGLDQGIGKDWDEDSQRLAASALVMAKEKGFSPSDDLQLVFNAQTERHAAGTVLHLVRTGATASPDPAANRAHMLTADALSRSAEDRYSQVQSIGVAQTELQRLSQQQEIVRTNDAAQSGPKLAI